MLSKNQCSHLEGKTPLITTAVVHGEENQRHGERRSYYGHPKVQREGHHKLDKRKRERGKKNQMKRTCVYREGGRAFVNE